MSTMNWKDPETRSKLFLAILAQSPEALTGKHTESIATYLGCTPKAVSHQITALKKEIETFKSDSGDTPKSAVTPSKRKKATPKAPSAKKKTKAAREEVVEDDESEKKNSDDEAEAAAEPEGSS